MLIGGALSTTGLYTVPKRFHRKQFSQTQFSCISEKFSLRELDYFNTLSLGRFFSSSFGHPI